VVLDEAVELGVRIVRPLEQVMLLGVCITLLSPEDPKEVELGVNTAGDELEDEAPYSVPEPGGLLRLE